MVVVPRVPDLAAREPSESAPGGRGYRTWRGPSALCAAAYRGDGGLPGYAGPVHGAVVRQARFATDDHGVLSPGGRRAAGGRARAEMLGAVQTRHYRQSRGGVFLRRILGSRLSELGGMGYSHGCVTS